MGQINWFEHCYGFKGLSLIFRRFAFVDVEDHLAAQLFAEQGVRLYAAREYQHADYSYVFVICKVRKRDAGKFLTALTKLPNKMLLCGYPDYLDFCREVRKRFDASVAERAG